MPNARQMRVGALCLLLATIGMGRTAFAQIDISGEWGNRFHEDAPHRGAGPEVGDFTGLPLNAAGRLKAESWDASILSRPERQCIPHAGTYAMRGPAAIRFWKQSDTGTGQLIAYHMQGTYGRPRTFWMDGRSHPSEYAPHTWTGFSTGRWEGNALVVTTTHLKVGWIQRNGAATSDKTTMTEHFIRHGDNLLVISVVDDPVYFDEPFIRTSNWVLNVTGNASAFGTCGPAQIADEAGVHPKGYVPHHLPGANDQILEFTTGRGVPREAAGGGADTIYPEYTRTAGKRAAGQSSSRPGQQQSQRRAGEVQNLDNTEIEVLPVQGNVHMLAGAGGNVVVQVGDEGVLVLDTSLGQLTDKIVAAIRRLSDKPIRYIVNTHVHPDHTGGNENLSKAGARVADNFGSSGGRSAAIIAHENVVIAMSSPRGNQPALPSGMWPTDTYFGGSKEIFFNGEGIQLFHQPAAHTDGDSVVYFRRSDVVVAGDVFITTSYPVIDTQRGGSLSGVIDALNHIIDLTIPRDWQEGGTMVIPGHGRLGDESDVVEYRDMVTIIRDRIQAMAKKGMTLEQVKAARPTLDYDGRYGATTGAWTTDMFVEAAYRTLGGVK